MAEALEESDLGGTDAFSEFFEARDLQEIQSAFSSLCQSVDIDSISTYDGFYSNLKSKLQQWKCQDLWRILDARASLKEYSNQTVCKGKRVLIVGAGPVGLRMAIEAALLGAEVDVVEKRTNFSRNNVLHLWPFLIDDLRALGAKKFYGKFCAGSIDHISIRTLQCILLKTALIFGVKVHFPVKFEDYIEPKSSSGGWCVVVDKPKIARISGKHFDAIISADGKQHSLKNFQSNLHRCKLAIAITANFVNKNTDSEVAVKELCGLSYLYNQSFFKSLAEDHNIDLENIVYYKDETHYFVMTAKKENLLERGVLKKDHSDSKTLLSRNNVNNTALEQYAKDAAVFSTKQGLDESLLEFAINHHGKKDVAIFDFTSLFQAEEASQILEKKEKRLLLSVVGDSLLEPFWPTGSGIGRGFLGVLDTAWMLKRFAEGQPTSGLLETREKLYHHLTAVTSEQLHKKTQSYTINPHSRYPNLTITSDEQLQPVTRTYSSSVHQRKILSPIVEEGPSNIHLESNTASTIPASTSSATAANEESFFSRIIWKLFGYKRKNELDTTETSNKKKKDKSQHRKASSTKEVNSAEKKKKKKKSEPAQKKHQLQEENELHRTTSNVSEKTKMFEARSSTNSMVSYGNKEDIEIPEVPVIRQIQKIESKKDMSGSQTALAAGHNNQTQEDTQQQDSNGSRCTIM